MKPTTESIKGAYDLATDISSKADATRIQLSKAIAYFIAGSPNNSIRELECARSHIATLRRTQTAALRHIDDALRSARQ